MGGIILNFSDECSYHLLEVHKVHEVLKVR